MFVCARQIEKEEKNKGTHECKDSDGPLLVLGCVLFLDTSAAGTPCRRTTYMHNVLTSHTESCLVCIYNRGLYVDIVGK